MSRGCDATSASYPTPSASRVPARRFSMTTSAVATIRRNPCRPASDLRSCATLRLFRSSRLKPAPARLRGGGRTPEPAAQPADVARFGQEAGHVPLDPPLVSMDGARDGRGTRGHRLQQDDPEGLLAGRGGAEDVGGLVEAGLVDL